MEPRTAAAARPSSFTQQLQSHVVDVSPSANFDYVRSDVDDAAPGRRQTPSASSSSWSSTLHLASPDHPRTGFTGNDDRCAASSDVGVAVDDAQPYNVAPIPPTSSLPVAEHCQFLPPQPQPSAMVVVSPLLGGDGTAADRKSAVALRGGIGDDTATDRKSPVALRSGACDDTAADRKSAVTLRSGAGDDDGPASRQPLSSGWATALAAATIAGKAAAATATKRRPNTAKSGGASFNIRASRSLFCLTTSNPIRKLSISVVEWKYPLRSSQTADSYVYNCILRHSVVSTFVAHRRKSC